MAQLSVRVNRVAKCVSCGSFIQGFELKSSRPYDKDANTPLLRVHARKSCRDKAKILKNPVRQLIDLTNDDSTPSSKPSPRPRRIRDWLDVGTSQKRTRRAEGDQALTAFKENLINIGIPYDEIVKPEAIVAEQILHFSPQQRGCQLRQVPCYNTVRSCRKKLSTRFGTETAVFASPNYASNQLEGAHIADPVKFVNLIAKESPFIAIGGDKGTNITKLGITYLYAGVQTFACLVAYAGADDWDELSKLLDDAITPFVGDTALKGFKNIWSYFQHLIDDLDRVTDQHKGAFINGDWLFLNAVLGLMTASSTHPCPICIINHNNFLGTAPHRTEANTWSHSHNTDHFPLLTVPSDHIIPTPLHVFLGVGNKIITEVFSALFGAERVQQAISSIKTIHSHGCTGLSSWHSLNGPELIKFLKKADSFFQDSDKDSIQRYTTLIRIMNQLQHFLLTLREWDDIKVDIWQQIVKFIQSNWREQTNTAAFPKIHMLVHAVEFARKHKFLSIGSESPMESFHHQFKVFFHQRHINQSRFPSERFRRCIADCAVLVMQPIVEAANELKSLRKLKKTGK